MANFKTAIAAENEILKATDVTFGYDSAIDNVAVAMLAVLSGADNNFVIGGKVTPYGNGGLNVSIAPIFSLNVGKESVVAETEITEPVSFEEADSSLDRIDIVEVRAKETAYDVQTRAINNPTSGTKSYQEMATKKKITLDIAVKKGSNGSASAPAVDSGFIKIAEVIIPAGTTNITAELIKNITARKSGVENEDWTADKDKTFNPGYLSEIFHSFLVAHNEDGSHKSKVIKSNNIDFGTGSAQVKGSDIPSASSLTIHGTDYDSQTSLTALVSALVANVNALYGYSNDILSRYSFIEDLPVACSTENVDVVTGGPTTIDGIVVTEGQLVFLKNQTNAKENGLWEVQSGAWNRYTGYDANNSMTHKFVVITAGTENKGKIFYLNGDSYTLGKSELNFVESKLSYNLLPFTFMVRDKFGRAKVAAPKDEDDIARKAEVDAEAQARSQAISSLAQSFQQSISKEASEREHAYNAMTQSFLSHAENKSNPHGVTAEQVGLGRVNDTPDNEKSVKHAQKAEEADTVDGYHAGNGVNMLVPVVAFNSGEKSGFIKLGNGLIMQWGYVDGPNRAVKIEFPIEFKSRPHLHCAPHAGEQYGHGYDCEGYDVTSKGFTVYKAGTHTDWFAIGF